MTRFAIGDLAKAIDGSEAGDATNDVTRVDEPVRAIARPLLTFLSQLLSAATKVVEQVKAAPEIAGHEAMLKALGDHELMARLMANLFRHWGEGWAAEVNDGRRAGSLIRKIAKAPPGRGLAISRLAAELGSVCRAGYASVTIERAIRETSTSMALSEFDAIVEAASRRDVEACNSLRAVCGVLAAATPRGNGRPISHETARHVFFARYMESRGFKQAYTFADLEDDYVDSLTRATRDAVANPDFSPVYARRLLRSGSLPPVVKLQSRKGARLSSTR